MELGDFLLQVPRHARQGPTCTRPGDKRIEHAARLRKDLGARGPQVRRPVRLALELVREEAHAAIPRPMRRRVVPRAAPRQVDKVVRAGDRGRGHALDLGAELAQEIGLFDGDVGGHADVAFVPARAGQRREGDACAAYGAFVDGVPAVRDQVALGFGGEDHGEGDAVLRTAAAAVEKLGFGEDGAPQERGERFQAEERGVADGGFDAF